MLPKGLHRIRHYGLFANAILAPTISLAPANCSPYRKHTTASFDHATEPDQPRALPNACPCCGGRMIIIETFARGCQPKHAPPAIRIDTS